MDFERMRAMVLSAGFGTRMGELTREIPKPMLPLHGRPILEWILAHLAREGFQEVAVNLHFRPEMIREHFGDGSKLGLTIAYSEEPQLLGTAGGVKKMETFFRQSDPFLVQYGDVVTDQDFSAMLAFHREKKALATLLLHQRAKSNSVVSLDGEQRIVGFLERPSEEARQGVTSPWVNSGICLCAAEMLDHIPRGTACDLPRDIFRPLLATGRLFGFALTGRRCAIDSPQRLEEAQRLFAMPPRPV
jgi:mannose-1-phosphate guanylyltransferase/phosphomannomutase